MSRHCLVRSHSRFRCCVSSFGVSCIRRDPVPFSLCSFLPLFLPPSFQPRNLKIFTQHNPALLPTSPTQPTNEEEYVVSRIRHRLQFISPRIISLTASSPTEWHPTTRRGDLAAPSPVLPSFDVVLRRRPPMSSFDLPCPTRPFSPARPRPELAATCSRDSRRRLRTLPWTAPTRLSAPRPRSSVRLVRPLYV